MTPTRCAQSSGACPGQENTMRSPSASKQQHHQEIQRQVAQHLWKSEAFRRMSPRDQHQIQDDTARIVATMAEGRGAPADPYAIGLEERQGKVVGSADK